MFERFTDRARRVVVLAQEEARALSHHHIGTEHLLLGLIREGDGVAGHVLTELGVQLQAAQQQVREIVGEGQEERGGHGHMPFTPRAKKVLELSLREAQQLGHDYIGTEHLLLGLIREGHGVAVQVLQRLGVSSGQVREQALRSVRPGAAGPGRPLAAHAGGVRVGWAWPGQLSQVQHRLDEVFTRLAAIERHLGIGQPAGGGMSAGASVRAATGEPPASAARPGRADPLRPGGPDRPDEPDEPGTPAEPGPLARHGQAGGPGDPGGPGGPGGPGDPGGPGGPGDAGPGEPRGPVQPGAPAH